MLIKNSHKGKDVHPMCYRGGRFWSHQNERAGLSSRVDVKRCSAGGGGGGGGVGGGEWVLWGGCGGGEEGGGGVWGGGGGEWGGGGESGASVSLFAEKKKRREAVGERVEGARWSCRSALIRSVLWTKKGSLTAEYPHWIAYDNRLGTCVLMRFPSTYRQEALQNGEGHVGSKHVQEPGWGVWTKSFLMDLIKLAESTVEEAKQIVGGPSPKGSGKMRRSENKSEWCDVGETPRRREPPACTKSRQPRKR